MSKNWKKFIPACIAGNILELYEFIIYGYFAKIIGEFFFPAQDKYSALFSTFAVFATGCLIRPFSAVALGFIGDKLGRKISLIFSVGIMAVSTLGIGLLPTYSQIGVLAPVMLVVFRVGQGLSMTSEEVGAALFLTENAPIHEKGFASCFILGSLYIGLFFGSIVSALVLTLFDEPILSNWGWRIPFIIGGIIGLITLSVRIRQPESLEFLQLIKDNTIHSNPFLELFRQYKLLILKITFLCSLFAVSIYLFAVYVPNTMDIVHVTKNTIMLICSLGFIIAFCISLITGKLVDRIGTTIPILISPVGLFIFAYPIFYLLSLHSFITSIISYFLFSILIGISAGAIMYATIKNFPINIRFSGSCISFNLSMSIFGGTAPLLALYLTKISNNLTVPCLLIMLTSILTIFSLLIEHTKKPLGTLYMESI